ncbi:hypothetical protein JYT28_00860 [Desulfobulbus sp. AH-315-M07]|nr:hypothetical protein [Desulfobulbus sp. AH-315-M07]
MSAKADTASGFVDLRLETGSQCTVTEIQRAQKIHVEHTRNTMHVSFLVTGIIFTSLGSVALVGGAIGSSKKAMDAGGASLFLGAGLWPYLVSAVGSGTSETEGAIEEVERQSRDEMCNAKPKAGVELALIVRPVPTSLRQRELMLGTTNARGRIRVDLRAAFKERFPGWPRVEPQLSSKAEVVLADSPGETIGTVDLLDVSGLQFGAHRRYIESQLAAARQRREAKRRAEEEERNRKRRREEEDSRRQRDAAARRARECHAKCASSCRGQPACASQCVASRCR